MMTGFGSAEGAFRIDLAETPDFDLGGLRVSPARREVRMNGERRELEPRVAQVLVALASARPGVVSRDRLIEQCWDGRIVGDDAINRCIVALRHLARDFSPEPFAIETVPRVGYSLIERPDAVPARGAGKAKAKVAIGAFLVLVLVAAGLTLSWSRLWRVEAAPASIAVLPFRNLSGGEPYFAEGVGEEILSQLSREPQFRVAGRVSSSQFGTDPDVREVARRLHVDYVLEGSVRTQGDRVRVNANLTRSSDGIRLWSDSYDGNLDDIFAIQQRTGRAIAGALRRRLVHTPPGGARTVDGEAYALYLNARGLVRSRNPQSGQDAIGLLQQAIRLDPGFAPAWSSLAEALQLDGRTKGTEGLIAVLPRAHRAARRALQLDPNLAEAHGVLAMLLGNDSPEAVAHLRRAAELDPRSGEGLIRLGAAHYISGEYAEGMAAYRRARDLDPLWPVPVRILVDVTSEMGDRTAAEAVARRGLPDDIMGQHFALGRVAWLSGDFSEAARRWSIVASDTASRWASPARLSLEDATFMLHLSANPPSRPPLPSLGQNRQGPRVWMSAPPSPSAWRNRNRSFAAALVNHDVNVVAAKRMLIAGRARELAATYDGPTGLLYMRPGVRAGVCDLHEAALVALALRGAGRRDEADALLREADALIRAAYRRGEVPTWFDEDAAAIWAVQGRTGPALDALERALRRGGVHAGRTDLPKLEDEPALRSLRGDPRFEALRSRYEAHFAREREETARALGIPVS
jgi:TolB-like protein/DNA-binding winged helix-turn-helix (wHTH) protein/Flp pilus assembly protein TadD